MITVTIIVYFYQLLKKLPNIVKKIFICATEQSGDNIGANVIFELLKNNPDIIFEGVGGTKMKKYLSKHYFSLVDFKTIGIIEILFSINKYIKMIKFLSKIIFTNKYDLVISIDSPDFNYPLMKKVRKIDKNIKIIHVVAPSVWAWRQKRAKKFAKIFNELLVLFDFESDYFIKYNLKTTFIGHPVFFIKNTNIKTNISKKFIAFLPGSRLNELNKLLPFFQIAHDYILENNIDYKIFIPTLPHLKDKIFHITKNWKIKTFVTTDIIEIENYYSLTAKAIVCSGTASLEIAKRNIPQFVIYKLNFITELIAKNFIRIKYVNIINIMENKMIIPEVLNSKLNNKSFLINLKQLIYSDLENIKQIDSINKTLVRFETNTNPYALAAERISFYF